jgi:hypothetical protein
MEEKWSKLDAPNLIVVDVDEKCNGDYGGRVWTQYDRKPAVFHSLLGMIWIADHFFDEIQFPQRAEILRSFREETKKTVQGESVAGNKKRIVMRDISDNRGKEGTFIVQVKYRQNTTWQGQVIWAEENREEYFRSALELLLLMDNALESRKADDVQSAEDHHEEAAE